ncbi:glutamate receptor ionotropic, kainate glr-3-like isoform X2 [Culex pipiens pallens]|uniref:glutamate receptor ionotropic, kainate glr-3-like isoform X2 n=1 Tax=Culex pipiens pallens TaxID=42434 RepID=UPI00195358A2|nr:glutamate receptor ionotropic, kainate glr-3-like isoform X2 [Culex pipiens pallens]
MTPTDVDVLTNDDERAGSHEITSGRLTRPLPVEQRNDFFGRVKFTLGVLMETAGQENGGGAGGHVPVYGDAGTLLRVLPKFLGASIGIKPILQTSADGTQDIVSALQDHEVDVVYSRINVDVALERKISYSFAVYHEFRNVYLRQPELSEIRDIYLAPITTTLAVAFLALTITLAVMLRLINNLHVTTRWKRNQHAPPTDHVSGSDAFLWFMGIFCMQGSTINPNCQSSATIVITALLFQLIVYNAYSASITSKLSIYLDEVTDLHGLLHATDFEVGFVRNRSDEAYLVANRDRDTSEILKRSMKNPTIKVEHYREGLHRAVETKFALFGRHGAVRGAIRNLAATDFCELSEVAVLSTYQKTAFAFVKDSPYRKVLNYEIIRLLQHGIVNRELPFMLPGMAGCNQAKLFNKAKLSDVFSCFAVLLMGMANAFLVVLGEKFVENIRSSSERFRME